MSEKFPNPNENEQNDQVEKPEVLDEEPKKEEFKGLGEVDEEGLRKLIEETMEKA